MPKGKITDITITGNKNLRKEVYLFMQKYHSFLNRIKGNLNDVFSVKVSKFKNGTISVAYILAATLLVLSPNSMTGTKFSAVVKSQAAPNQTIEQETEHAAIIQTDNQDDFLTELEGNQLLQMQKENEEVKELVTQKSFIAPLEGMGVQAQDHASNISVNLETLASEEELLEKSETKNNNIEINEEIQIDIAEYINVTEEEELEAYEEKAKAVQEAARIAAEEKAAEEARIAAEEKAAEEARIAAEEAAAKAKAEEEAKKKAEAERKAAEVSSYSVGSYSNNEVAILERIVEAEATGGDVKSKILVANVILNRVNNSIFPNTIEGVVFQKGQFSPIRDGRYYSVSITSSTKEAVSRALQGENYSDGALYFAARKAASQKNMRWFDNNLTYLFSHGGHEYFR